GWRVACYSPEGRLLREIQFAAAHTSCPAFGGPDLSTLFCTSAAWRVADADRALSTDHGKVFFVENIARGQAEHQVQL
ncbi:MAG: SMP-30/gluconolactonase/LRE family protein, partial [Boseongicola sp.]